jgi:RimJ/RimL family protein N-acetyltransferase
VICRSPWVQPTDLPIFFEHQRDVGKEFWGRGIASSAVREFLEVDTSRPLFAFVAKENLGSLCVLQKNGFTIVEEVSDRWGDAVTEILMQLV